MSPEELQSQLVANLNDGKAIARIMANFVREGIRRDQILLEREFGLPPREEDEFVALNDRSNER